MSVERLPFRSPISAFTATGSKLSRALQLSPGRGRMLATAFHSPATTAAFTASIPGSKFLGLPLRFPADRFRCPVHLRLRYRPTVCSAIGRLNASDPLQLPRSTRSAASPASTPLRDCYIPPDQSVLPDLLQINPPSDSARSPFAPRCGLYY